MAAAPGQTIAGINVALGLQSAAFLRGIQQATQATANATQQMQRHLGGLNSSFAQTGKAVTQFANGFKSLFAVQQIYQAARAAAEYSDSWQQATNKIAAAEQISGRHARSLSAVNQIAIETRSSLDATADLYAKLLRVTGDVAKSEDEVARATRVVAQGFKAGGASTLEMENGIRQLAQALGSGFLQGDELRSIRENAPLIAQALANEFQTTVGGLKQLGAEGKITSDRIFKALLASENEVGGAFARTNSTIGESFTNVNNALTQYIGLASRSSGASALITNGLNNIAKNMDQVGRAAKWTPIGIVMQELGVLIDSAREKWQLLYDATRPNEAIELGDAFATSSTNLFKFSEVVDDVPAKMDLMTMSANRLTTTGNTLAKSDLFKMGDFALFDLKGINFEPFLVKTEQVNQHVKDFRKHVTETHSGLLRDIGTFTEQWAQELEDIKKKYPAVADQIRASVSAAVDQSGQVLSAMEGFGASISPLQKLHQAQKEIELRFGSSAEGVIALQGATRRYNEEMRTMATNLGVVYNAQEKYQQRVEEIAISDLGAAERARATAGAALEYKNALDALQEALGVSLSPMQEHDATLRQIEASNISAAEAVMYHAQANAQLMESQLAVNNSVGLSTSPLEAMQLQLAKIDAAYAANKISATQVTQAQIGAYAGLGSAVMDVAGSVTGAFKGLFKDNKALAIADAVINTAAAIMKTLAQTGATPWGLAMAGIAAAVGAAQIATIASTQPGSTKSPSVKGGGGGGGKKIKAVEDAGKSSTSSSSGMKEAQLKQTVTVVIEGDSFGPEHFKKMVAGLNGVIADGAVLRVENR
jgi:tape measure domain-containing protein